MRIGIGLEVIEPACLDEAELSGQIGAGKRPTDVEHSDPVGGGWGRGSDAADRRGALRLSA